MRTKLGSPKQVFKNLYKIESITCSRQILVFLKFGLYMLKESF